MNDSTTATTHARLARLAGARWRVAIALTLAMVGVYFGFIALIAFHKPLMGSLVTRGISVGILLGALVIVASWLLTWVYVRWANATYDVELKSIREGEG